MISERDFGTFIQSLKSDQNLPASVRACLSVHKSSRSRMEASRSKGFSRVVAESSLGKMLGGSTSNTCSFKMLDLTLVFFAQCIGLTVVKALAHQSHVMIFTWQVICIVYVASFLDSQDLRFLIYFSFVVVSDLNWARTSSIVKGSCGVLTKWLQSRANVPKKKSNMESLRKPFRSIASTKQDKSGRERDMVWLKGWTQSLWTFLLNCNFRQISQLCWDVCHSSFPHLVPPLKRKNGGDISVPWTLPVS